MNRHPELSETAVALLRALNAGEARGMRVLSERAAGRSLFALADLDVLRTYLMETRDLIDRGYLIRKAAGSSVLLSLSRKGVRAIRPATRSRFISAGLVLASLAGCAQLPPQQPRALLMGAPVLTGLGQVRDPQTGVDYFVPCNPCGMPTMKTPMLGGEVESSVSKKNTASALPLAVAKLDAHTVATLAMQNQPAVQFGGAGFASVKQATQQVTVLPAKAEANMPGSAVIRNVPFLHAESALSADGKKLVGDLVPLAMTAKVVYLRGRTDSTGTAVANRSLALSRANAVRTAFINAGVSPKKLKLSYCASCFIQPNDTEAGRSANRRVEIELVMSAS